MEDRCEPKLKTIELPVLSKDPAVLHWPLCTPLLQCGGCCGHDALECRPKVKQQTMLQVGKAYELRLCLNLYRNHITDMDIKHIISMASAISIYLLLIQDPEKIANNYIAITGSASLSYPPSLGQRGGASNALKAGPRKQHGPATRFQPRVDPVR